MNIQQSISTQTIQHISQLAAGHPVFLVTAADDVFVIKAEDAKSATAVRSSAEIMTFVDPKAASRVLTKTEIFKVRDFATANPGSLVEKTPGTLSTYISRALAPPLPGRGSQYQAVMTIMEAKVRLNDIEEAALDVVAGDKSKAKLFTKALNANGNMRRLGMILAADAFNDNQDRVNFENNGGKKVGDPPNWIKLKCIWNPGNIFIADEKKRMTVIGLDSFNPASAINQNPSEFDTRAFYSGSLLRADKAAERRALLQNVADDIEALLGPRNRKFSFLQQTRLPKNAVSEMEAGMNEGAAKILTFLKQKYANGGIPLAMQKRLSAIGWLTRSNFAKL